MDNTNSGLKKILVIDDEGALHSPMDSLRRTPYGGTGNLRIGSPVLPP
jgi:hypothetical protein